MKKTNRKIAISGLPGSGKSTAIETISKYYGLTPHSIGTLRREFAKNELGMTIDEMNELRLKDKSLDTKFDNFQKGYMANNTDWVIEGRLPYFFAPAEAIKIFYAVDKIEAGKRIFHANRDSEKKYSSLDETIEMIETRMKSDKEAYQELYNTNCYDVSQFDIIIDTTNLDKYETQMETIKRINFLSNF